jgi:hypothetical protein
MSQNPNVLPIAAITAIILFLLKELFEFYRRWSANTRKLEAIRRFIAAECQRNDFALHRLLNQVEEIDEALSDGRAMEIERRESGAYRLAISDDSGNESSAPVPLIHIVMAEKYLFEAAALNAGLFEDMENNLNFLIDAEHVRNSLIEYVAEDKMHLPGFAEFAKEELNDAIDSNRELYFRCTCEPLSEWRVR